jgi:uncharacterized protein YkwD
MPRLCPRRLRSLSVLPVAVAATFALAAPASAATACQSADAAPQGDNIGQVQGTVLCLLNRERTSRGLGRLQRNGKLDSASTKYSRKMVAGDFFSHVAPDGSTMASRIKASGYLKGARGWSIGENIAWGTGRYATPQEIVEGWMNSAGHRQNILNSGFREIGIGVALGAPGKDGGATYTTNFGKRS